MYQVKNIKFSYIKPYFILVENEFKLRKAMVTNGTLFWNINGTRISYKQIKEVK